MQAFDRNKPLPRAALAPLRHRAPSEKVTLDEMPAGTQVCNCNGVSKEAIGLCVAGGRRTAKAVTEATRAGMGCGACKALVGELVEWFLRRGRRGGPLDPLLRARVPLPKPSSSRPCASRA
jgi:nitrite reductase (NADH) large subunit